MLFAFSIYWTDDIPQDAFLWESEVNFSSFPDLESGKALGFKITGKTKENNLMRRKHIIKYKTHSLPPPLFSTSSQS